MDITDYVDRMSSNRNILQQKTYVIVSYYAAEIGGALDNYSKDEVNSMCFTELYTRCQNIASALANSQVSCRILDSEELSELLYIAYNRDEAELLQFSKALDSQYDSLYSTGKEVLEKKQQMLDEEIEIESIDVATDSIMKADELKRIEELNKVLAKRTKVKEKAKEIIEEYEDRLDDRVFELAIEQVDKITDSRYEKEVQAKKSKIEKNNSERKPAQAITGKKIIRKRLTDDKV
jgi:ribosomal protein S17E